MFSWDNFRCSTSGSRGFWLGPSFKGPSFPLVQRSEVYKWPPSLAYHMGVSYLLTSTFPTFFAQPQWWVRQWIQWLVRPQLWFRPGSLSPGHLNEKEKPWVLHQQYTCDTMATAPHCREQIMFSTVCSVSSFRRVETVGYSNPILWLERFLGLRIDEAYNWYKVASQLITGGHLCRAMKLAPFSLLVNNKLW